MITYSFLAHHKYLLALLEASESSDQHVAHGEFANVEIFFQKISKQLF